MANGPLGGFMPTPPSPGQPPQVKLETSAESRGAFNKFLGTLPSNGAIAPIPTGVVASSTAPVSPMTSNVNIFQPQMSQMAPMAPMIPAPMTMTPSGKPVQNFFFGGSAMSGGGFSDADIGSQIDSFDSGQEDPDDNNESFVDDDPVADIDFNVVETPTVSESERQQNIRDAQDFFDSSISAPVVDTRPRTNIRNVGPLSNLRFDPQFTADLLGRRFGDSNIAGFMAPTDFAQTRQGGATAPTLTSGLPSFGTGTDFLRERELAKLRPSNVNQIAPVTTTVGTGATTRPNELDLLGLGGLGVDLSSPQSRSVLDNQFTQIAGLPTIVPGARGLPSIDTVADDLVQGAGELEQRSGANINNPGNIRTGGGFDGEIGVTKDGFAIFDNMKSGVDAIGKLATTYGSKRNIDTVRQFANRYSPAGENTPKQIAGKINVISNALNVGPDEKVDFTDPSVQAKLTPAVITSEIGADKTRDVANVLKGFSPSPLSPNLRDLNPNVTSNIDQLATLDPIQPPANLGIAPIGEQRPESRGEIPSLNPFGRARPDLVTDREGDVLAEIAERNQDRARSIADRGFPVSVDEITGIPSIAPTVDNLLRLGQEAQQRRNLEKATIPDQALETLEGRRDRLPDQVLDIDTRSIQPFSQSAQVQKLLDRGRAAQEAKQQPEKADRDAAALALGIGTPPLDTTNITQTAPFTPLPDIRNLQSVTTRGIGTADSIVGDDEEFAELNLDDILGRVTQNRVVQERVADILNRPKMFKDTFKIGDIEFPNLIATLINKAGSFFDRRLFDAITKKGLDAVVDPDTGRIIGAKDEFGNLIEGRDLEQFGPSQDNVYPIIEFLKKAREDKEEEKQTTPNVIGGETPRTLENVPTVVSSPFQARDINFRPVRFDGGNLNDLIARITGVPTPRRLQEGGTVAAVDRFLSKVS